MSVFTFNAVNTGKYYPLTQMLFGAQVGALSPASVVLKLCPHQNHRESPLDHVARP